MMYMSKAIPIQSNNDGKKEEEEKVEQGQEEALLKPSPGVHLVPRKLVVLDREKTMRQNKSVKESDFIEMNKIKGPNKTILLMGASGVGKTTLLNSMMYYLWNCSTLINIDMP